VEEGHDEEAPGGFEAAAGLSPGKPARAGCCLGGRRKAKPFSAAVTQ